MLHKHFKEHFERLDELLRQYEQWWQPRPFYTQQLDWMTVNPALSQSLLELSEPHLSDLTNNRRKLYQWLVEFEPELGTQLLAVLELEPPQSTAPNLPHSKFEQVGVPGRKWQQISRFTDAIVDSNYQENRQIIDWCSGKGHLAQQLARHCQQPVHCLELDKSLCKKGQAKSKALGLAVGFYCHDVMQPLPENLPTQTCHHTALHACGELHHSMLKQASKQRAPQISLSPCCYHKIEAVDYQPLSRQAQSSELYLSRDDLHLAVEETVTGGQRIARLRQQEQLWRLAFNILQQQCLNTTEYLPLPSIPKAMLSADFTVFCRWAAECKNVPLPTFIDTQELLVQAELIRKKIQRLELVRKAFQRPLELWLIMDRVLFLCEQGYQCQLELFCEKSVSPRNFLIQATLKTKSSRN